MERFDRTNDHQKLLELTQKKNQELLQTAEQLRTLIKNHQASAVTALHELGPLVTEIQRALDALDHAGVSTPETKNPLGAAKKNLKKLSRILEDILSRSKSPDHP
jgi:hypothetical protein